MQIEIFTRGVCMVSSSIVHHLVLLFSVSMIHFKMSIIDHDFKAAESSKLEQEDYHCKNAVVMKHFLRSLCKQNRVNGSEIDSVWHRMSMKCRKIVIQKRSTLLHVCSGLVNNFSISLNSTVSTFLKSFYSTSFLSGVSNGTC